MTEPATKTLLPFNDLEPRQKLAAFHQGRIVAVQTAAIAAAASAAALWPIGLSIAVNLHLFEPIACVTGVAWLGLTTWLLRGYAQSALAIKECYLKEHEEHFGSVEPYELQTFLFGFASNFCIAAPRSKDTKQ